MKQFPLRYNMCVLKQITFFFNDNHQILVLPLGREKKRGISGALADIPADILPIWQMNRCVEKSVHYTLSFTVRATLEGRR